MGYYLQPERWQHYVQLPRGVAVARKLQDGDWMRAALHKLRELDAL